MDRVCIECNEVYGKSGQENGVTGGICDDCFIRFLEQRIKWLEKMIEMYPGNGKCESRQQRLEFLKALLVKKLIQRQEKGG